MLLPPIWRQIEESPRAAEVLNTSAIGEIGVENLVPIAQEDAQTKRFAIFRRDAKITIEFAAKRRIPGNGPPHPFLERFDFCQWRSRHQRE